jgi:GNAT superfamily N-acetyltransferase
MIADTIKIKPIKLDEWLPDRCLNGIEPFDPKSYSTEPGCPSLNYFQKNNRESLEQIYQLTINKYGGCGFVAWDNDKIIAYHNFFPIEIAKQIKFYGYGFDLAYTDNTLIHNCLTIVKGDYLRKGISSRLVKKSIDWAKANDWKRFEVHLVLPDCEKGWQSDQKSCLSFWKRFGFRIFKEYKADKETEQYYGVTKRYSIYLSLDN